MVRAEQLLSLGQIHKIDDFANTLFADRFHRGTVPFAREKVKTGAADPDVIKFFASHYWQYVLEPDSGRKSELGASNEVLIAERLMDQFAERTAIGVRTLLQRDYEWSEQRAQETSDSDVIDIYFKQIPLNEAEEQILDQSGQMPNWPL